MKEYRLVIAGCRDYNDYFTLSKEVDEHIKALGENHLIIIVSGGADGTDALGEKFAQTHNLPIEKYPAEWKKYGKAAGPRRNAEMARIADGIIVFWDGKSRGTQNMITCAKKENKPCKIIKIQIDTHNTTNQD